MPVVGEKLMVLCIITLWVIDLSVFRDIFRLTLTLNLSLMEEKKMTC